MKKTMLTLILFSCTHYILAGKHFVLIAAPGSGKGTLSQYLMHKYGYAHVCPGDIFRKEIKDQTPLGKKIKSTVERGEYVDKELVCRLISQHLTAILNDGKHFILDGFPRAKVSFDFLHQFLKKRNISEDVYFIQLKSRDQTCIKRVLNRIICPGCSMVYNRTSAAPTRFNICDFCNTRLISRTADTESIIKKRLHFFHTDIEPLLKDAEKLYKVLTIKTEHSIHNLMDTYEKLVEQTQSTRDY